MRQKFSFVFLLYSLLAAIAYILSSNIDGGDALVMDYLTLSTLDTVLNFILISIVFLCGTLLGERLFNSKKLVFNTSKYGKNIGIIAVAVDERSKGILISYILFILVSYLYVGEPLWLRDYYHLSEVSKTESEAAGSLMDLIGALAQLTIGMLPPTIRYYINENNIKVKVLNRIALFLSIVFLYGASTKMCAAVAFMYLLAGIMNNTGRFNKYSAIFFIAPFIILTLVLDQRNRMSYGILTLFDSLDSLVGNPLDVLVFGLQIVGSAVSIVAETKLDVNLSYSHLFIELSPLSGFAAGWYDIYDLRRLSFAVPYSALGTLAAYSYFYLFFYGIVYGITMVFLGKVLSKIFGTEASIFVVLTSIFVCGMLGQYNLRSTTRFIYYTFLLYMIVETVSKLLIYKRRKNEFI